MPPCVAAGGHAPWRDRRRRAMPKQKDLKRLVRERMAKTGESYTAARAQLITKRNPSPDEYAELADDDLVPIEYA